MRRALLVGLEGSASLFLLREMSDREDPWWDLKHSKDVEKTNFYLADVVEQNDGDDIIVLDVTGEPIKYLGQGVYYAEKLGIPELPQEMVDITKQNKTTENESTGPTQHSDQKE